MPPKLGEFPVAYAYESLCGLNRIGGDHRWSRVWKLRVAERIRCLVCLLQHGRLMMNSRLNYMRIGHPRCYHCGYVVENMLHVFRDCPLAVGIWLNTFRINQRENFFEENLQNWIDLNMNMELGMNDTGCWAEFWVTTCHALWSWRNKLSHDSEAMMPLNSWKEVTRRVNCYMDNQYSHPLITSSRRVVENISWKPPKIGWICLNTNGLSKGGYTTGYGGVLRGENGECICGFSKGLGSCDSYVAELWGAFEGLKLARARGFHRVELHVDF
jgi:hypothetical protein